MADRAFERAFNKAAVGSIPSSKEPKAVPQQSVSIPPDGQAQLDTPVQPGQAQAAINKVLAADEGQDFFSMLELPLPEVNELGRPEWSCSAGDVSRAFRRISVLVHPDKNPNADARRAFEALSAAHRQLRDPGLLEEILNKEVDRAKERREAAEANATPDERIAMNAAHRERAKELRHKEGQKFQDEIMRQLREKQDRAKRKRQALERSRRKSSDSDGNDSAQEEAARQPAVASKSSVVRSQLQKRSRPNLIF